jgi:hypothetical protein
MRWGQFFLILLLVLIIDKGYGQVMGQLKDTAAARNCPQALLSVLRPDSSLVRSTLSAKDGRFQFPGAWPAGNYILLVMHPDYITSFRPFAIGSAGAYDFGILPVLPKTDSLQAVVVTPGDLRPHFRRDTVEYNTAHIRMNINANVEGMIGRLPGLQVDAGGNITYNGQKIQRVQVDGKDLFGSDLTIVTRNLNADMIAKVQVLDSKSREALFTGIDDGQRIKTLNLTLKEDSKKGHFIKAEEGGSAQKYYQVNGILSSFKEKQQFMVLGMASNNDNTSLAGTTENSGPGLNLKGSLQDPLGASAGTGIPRAEGGAAHYGDKWGSYNDFVDGYCRYGYMLTRPFSNTMTEQILPDSLYAQVQDNSSVNRTSVQSFISHFTCNLDSLSEFQFAFGGGISRGQNEFTSFGNSSFNATLVNDGQHMISSEVLNKNWHGDLMWRLQGREKKARIFSLVASISKQSNNTTGYLYSLNHFYYPNGLMQSADTVDQRKAINNDGTNVDARINYTNPVWKGAVLGVSFGINLSNSHAQQSTFGRGDGKYDERVDSLSGYYSDNFLTQRGTINLQGRGKTFDYVLGGDLLEYDYQERNVFDNSLSKYHYLNFDPRFNANFNPSVSAGYALSYNATTQLPAFAQLQPIRNNIDPLNITLGNPNLHPSYTHSLGFNFHRGQLINYTTGFNLGLTSNSISAKTHTDNLGRQISQAVNTSGSVNGGLFFYLNTHIKRQGLDVSLNNNVTYGRTVNYVNDLLSKNDNYTATSGFSLAKYIANSYNFRITTNFSYTSTRSSINSGLKTSYWSQNHTAQLGFFPLKNWEINTNLNYTWRQKTSIFDNHNSVLLWNSAINRNFLNNTLTARLAINDILGQNAGITRTINANQISQTNSNVIGRYWMLSILYRFTKKGGK